MRIRLVDFWLASGTPGGRPGLTDERGCSNVSWTAPAPHWGHRSGHAGGRHALRVDGRAADRPYLAVAWLAAMALNPLSKFWLPRLARGLDSPRLITPGLVCLQALVTALLFIVMTSWLFLRGNDERACSHILSAGVLFCRSPQLRPVPRPAWCFGTLVTAALITLWQIDRETSLAAAVAVLLYAAVVTRDMLATSRSSSNAAWPSSRPSARPRWSPCC